MSRFSGESVAPRAGQYQVANEKGEVERKTFKAGERLPDNADRAFGPLRSGEFAPQAGVYANNLSGKEYSLKAGEAFPADEDGSDFIWVREIA